MFKLLPGIKTWCSEKISVNIAGQSAFVYCRIKHQPEDVKLGHYNQILMSDRNNTYIVGMVYWNDQTYTITEDRGGLSNILLSKIPGAKSLLVDWPCDCKCCFYHHGSRRYLFDTMIFLNDHCKWGRTPEENSEKNIISWLDSLGFDFSLRD